MQITPSSPTQKKFFSASLGAWPWTYYTFQKASPTRDACEEPVWKDKHTNISDFKHQHHHSLKTIVFHWTGSPHPTSCNSHSHSYREKDCGSGIGFCSYFRLPVRTPSSGGPSYSTSDDYCCCREWWWCVCVLFLLYDSNIPAVTFLLKNDTFFFLSIIFIFNVL